ncbi:MAG: hypothetical protein JXQ27_10625 [Acidobacteria bacterium]|nr:hypothetical protein [Acidobacteriota bacterium]
MRKRATWLAAMIWLMLLCRFITGQDLLDRGAFVIYNQGKTVGSEEFNIRILNGKGDIQSTTSYEISHENRQIRVTLESTLSFAEHLVPLAYDLSSTTNQAKQSLQVEFKPKLAVCIFTLAAGQQTLAVILPEGVSVVDENMFSHWSMVLARFDLKVKGTQRFFVFVPQMGSGGLGEVLVRYVERARIKVGAHSYRAHHYSVTTSSLTLEIWQDQTGRILRIKSPQNQAEVVRAQ